MPGSVTSVFSEPEDFAAALRNEGYLGLLITGRGHFRSRLIQITLHRLRLSAGDEQLSRIAFIAVPAAIVLISFPVGKGIAPVYGGVRMRAGEIMTLSPGERLHARTDGACRWAAVWIPVEELVEYGRALTGSSFGVLPVTQRWRPPPAASRRLRGLHAAAARMAAIRPQVLADAEAAHGLEQQLIHAVVECLSGGSADQGAPEARRHQDIMVRFERLLQTQSGRHMCMTEICAALGITAPLLRRLCAKHLGMSPTGYNRLRRMSRAHSTLRGADDDATSVSEIARRNGFRDLGRFAVNYRAVFGELPSTTLRRRLAFNTPRRPVRKRADKRSVSC